MCGTIFDPEAWQECPICRTVDFAVADAAAVNPIQQLIRCKVCGLIYETETIHDCEGPPQQPPLDAFTYSGPPTRVDIERDGPFTSVPLLNGGAADAIGVGGMLFDLKTVPPGVEGSVIQLPVAKTVTIEAKLQESQLDAIRTLLLSELPVAEREEPEALAKYTVAEWWTSTKDRQTKGEILRNGWELRLMRASPLDESLVTEEPGPALRSWSRTGVVEVVLPDEILTIQSGAYYDMSKLYDGLLVLLGCLGLRGSTTQKRPPVVLGRPVVFE